MLAQVSRFIGVGVTALIVHWLVVRLLVPLGLVPLLANVFGFVVAFNVSYFGHRKLTFKAEELSHSRTLPRFATVALSSFAVNEILYALLLTFTPLRYDLALLIVLGVVAVMTYLFSRFWAFAT
ncbi:GtrA family protein [Nitrincola iocasae]|jgi:putative flippase GtrA|uniref:GtrA family protein n=1 Tax=Nitrincola iocasae TaxID=2614693 RepID=A0A5J6LI93_9GAMM|nr:GtrA family protein [Nitrincola iocasae]QEW08093.1 GtrA family protein [Nitrincola iocasae]